MYLKLNSLAYSEMTEIRLFSESLYTTYGNPFCIKYVQKAFLTATAVWLSIGMAVKYLLKRSCISKNAVQLDDVFGNPVIVSTEIASNGRCGLKLLVFPVSKL